MDKVLVAAEDAVDEVLATAAKAVTESAKTSVWQQNLYKLVTYNQGCFKLSYTDKRGPKCVFNFYHLYHTAMQDLDIDVLC